MAGQTDHEHTADEDHAAPPPEQLLRRREERAGERWPRLMRAQTAAAYCDEVSVQTFRRGVGRLWPHPKRIAGKGERWLREDLDQAIDRLTGRTAEDAADLL